MKVLPITAMLFRQNTQAGIKNDDAMPHRCAPCEQYKQCMQRGQEAKHACNIVLLCMIASFVSLSAHTCCRRASCLSVFESVGVGKNRIRFLLERYILATEPAFELPFFPASLLSSQHTRINVKEYLTTFRALNI